MVAPQQTTITRSREQGRRRRGRLIFDFLVLVAIVAVGAAGAFAAGLWAMPPTGSLAGDQGQGAGQIAGRSVSGLTASSGSASGNAASPSGLGSTAAGAATTSAAPGNATVVTAHGTPWQAWAPTTPGTATQFQLPAPWTGGALSTITVTVYLPGGYLTSGRSYPVIYEAPFSYQSWNMWIGTKALLDGWMSSATIPASIVVFVQPAHGPYHDTECANSKDGRQQFETFLSTTLVQTIDSRYRTIQTAAARSVMGFSQGGFCAAMLALRHPDVFSTALAISGYYQAGIVNKETPFAYLPFGGNAAYEASYSPLRLVGQLTPAQRASMQLVLEADPAQPFYGPQYAAMLAAAHKAGVSVVTQPMSIFHSWIVVKAVLPRMLKALAAREVALGVFG